MRASLIFGALAAVVAGVYLITRYEEDEGIPTVIDALGDWVTTLTTSEETRISQLEPETQRQVRMLITTLATEYGIDVHAGQTLRTSAQEKANVDAGKTAASLKYSWHELGRAIDIYPLLDGEIDYDAKNLDAYRKLHEVAVNMGFRSLAFNADGTKHLITNAKGKKIWDGGHIEWRDPYDTITQAVAAEGAAYGIA